MKFINNIKIITGALIMSTSFLTVSCDFLDIVPPEQAGLPDATKDADATLGFLYSCYSGIFNPIQYIAPEGSADEYALPMEWSNNGYASHNFAFDLNTPQDYSDARWDFFYNSIGQIHLFLQQLPNAQGVTNEQKTQWEAEANFLLAYYHFELLRFYGPCPINDRYYPQSITKEEMPGRSHYDYVTNWIVKLLDEKVIDYLPTDRDANDRGRATSTIAKALKAKALLYAASPLWNGSFPAPDWKNVVETPGYGYELISKTYDRNKWIKAEEAYQAALDEALMTGHPLYGSDPKHFTLYESEKVPLPYIPGREENNAENKSFKERVLLLRYMSTAKNGEGNTELIWGLNNSNDGFVTCSRPNRMLQQTNGNWVNGWSGISPLLNSIEKFYTDNGKMIDHDATFPKKDEWLQKANISGRPDIIKLHVGREPRFYAWMVYDQGDYSSMIVDGKPLRVEFKDNQKQGLNPNLFNRNHTVTGYLNQKFVRPNCVYSKSGGNNETNFQRPLLRTAELYLSLAECQAALGGDKEALALANLNQVHTRAGLTAITMADIKASGKTLMDWIRNERFVEFWGEGQRYFDVRRWVLGAEYLSAGKREGLNAEQMMNPPFEVFNQRVKVPQPYKWTNRMYIAPTFYSEIAKNPQLVQAPEY